MRVAREECQQCHVEGIVFWPKEKMHRRDGLATRDEGEIE